MERVRIATRKSPLALWQAEFVAAALRAHHPQLTVELVTMSTRGDKLLDSPLAKIGGKGLFVKELEHAMARGDADIAVHSMKDVPMAFPDGFCLPVICERGDPTDAFVSNQYDSLSALPHGAVVGTSSLRRQSQLMAQRPDLTVNSLRGNVGTRLSKLDSGEFDAIILASAGLKRLQLAERITQRLPANVCLPACGQGAVGIECRSDNEELIALLAPLHDADTASCVLTERAMNTRLNGGCQVPIAGHAVLANGQLTMEGLVASPDGQTLLRAEHVGPATAPQVLGNQVAETLLELGAGPLLAPLQEEL